MPTYRNTNILFYLIWLALFSQEISERVNILAAILYADWGMINLCGDNRDRGSTQFASTAPMLFYFMNAKAGVGKKCYCHLGSIKQNPQILY